MKDKTLPHYVLVTGASSGIGRACSRHLDIKGFHVIAGVRRESDAESLRNESSNRLCPVILDVCSHESIRITEEMLRNELPKNSLFSLINNAGIPLAGPLELLDLNTFRHQLETNLVGLLAITQKCIPFLRKSQGRIINIGSISGKVALPFLGPYSATKHALEAISDSLRIELRPWNISVTVIEAGNTDTSIRTKAISSLSDAAENLSPKDYSLYGPFFCVAASHRYRKMMSPSKVAELIEYILSIRKPKARYLLGRDARLLSLLQKLPTNLRDAIIAGKLPRHGQE